MGIPQFAASRETSLQMFSRDVVVDSNNLGRIERYIKTNKSSMSLRVSRKDHPKMILGGIQDFYTVTTARDVARTINTV